MFFLGKLDQETKKYVEKGEESKKVYDKDGEFFLAAIITSIQAGLLWRRRSDVDGNYSYFCESWPEMTVEQNGSEVVICHHGKRHYIHPKNSETLLLCFRAIFA